MRQYTIHQPIYSLTRSSIMKSVNRKAGREGGGGREKGRRGGREEEG